MDEPTYEDIKRMKQDDDDDKMNIKNNFKI